MKAKRLREWCDRMGDDADVELCLTMYYQDNWTTKFVAENQHTIEGIHGQGSKGNHGTHAPKIVLITSHAVRIVTHPCPICKGMPPED